MRIPGLWRARMMLHALRKRWQLARAERALARFPQQHRKQPHGLDAPLVVTLTSYPPRFGHLGKTLRSLLDQTVAADRTILWIAHVDMDRLPAEVLALCEHGLEIRACEDLRSYKKLIPAWREDPARYFVTADDDVYYPPHWLAGLVETARSNPRTVIAHRARVIERHPDGRFAPYKDWQLIEGEQSAGSLSDRIMPTGIGGVLYPPDAFTEEVCDTALFTHLAPHGDDIWFYWMARRAGVRQLIASHPVTVLEWPSAQLSALYVQNMLGDGNDRQIRAMMERFGAVS